MVVAAAGGGVALVAARFDDAEHEAQLPCGYPPRLRFSDD